MVKVKKEQQKRNPILWFLFAIVIPVLLAFGIAIVILSVAGIDVTGWAKDKGSNIPIISSMVTTKEDKDLKRQLEKANETIAGQKDELDDLNKEIDSLEGLIDDLEMDMKRLENRNKSEENVTNDDSAQEIDEEVKKVAASFRKMDKEKAADIIQNLDKNMAVAVLASLSGDVRGGILAEMEPKLAAELMEDMLQK